MKLPISRLGQEPTPLSYREKETSMIKALSLSKVWIARTAGLLVLAALAVVFFVAPMVAMGAGGANGKNQVLKTFKADFAGLINGEPPAGTTFSVKDFKVGDTAFKLVLSKTMPFEKFKKGQWISVNIKDASNQIYGFMATVDKINPTTKEVRVVIGAPANPAMVSQAAIKKFQGKLLPLNFNLDPAKKNVSFIQMPPSTGWEAALA
jgi:hypothetical protein